jgi:hypothetical protein
LLLIALRHRDLLIAQCPPFLAGRTRFRRLLYAYLYPVSIDVRHHGYYGKFIHGTSGA